MLPVSIRITRWLSRVVTMMSRKRLRQLTELYFIDYSDAKDC
jgi:hypothetical protein